MKRTSPSCRFVRRAAMSPAFSIAGPAVERSSAPISFAMMLASVVLPKPGGPVSSTWSSASRRLRAAFMYTRRFSLTWRWPMYSSIRVGRSVRSNWRSSSLAKLSFTRADIDSGGMLFSNPCEFLQTAPKDRFHCYVTAFGECGIDGFFRSRALIAEIEQGGKRVGAGRVFGRYVNALGFRSGFLCNLRLRELDHLVAQIDDESFSGFSSDSRYLRQSRQIVRFDRLNQ